MQHWCRTWSQQLRPFLPEVIILPKPTSNMVATCKSQVNLLWKGLLRSSSIFYIFLGVRHLPLLVPLSFLFGSPLFTFLGSCTSYLSLYFFFRRGLFNGIEIPKTALQKRMGVLQQAMSIKLPVNKTSLNVRFWQRS